jgi:flagella basal body P-ring formation protein FlgA
MAGRILVTTFVLLFAAVPATAQEVHPVAARDLPRGITLSAEDLEYPNGQAVEPASVSPGPGWVTRRVISRGEPLREPAVGRPQLVRAGEEVDVVWRGGAIQLRLRGTAMGAAAEGERVTVRIDARRRLDGVVAGPRLIHIQGARQ